RMRTRTLTRLAARGLTAEIEITLADWPSHPHVQGAALALTAESAQGPPATFTGLGERGKPAETVADEAVDELLAFLDAPARAAPPAPPPDAALPPPPPPPPPPPAAVDPPPPDQTLPPLALAPGRSEYTVTAVTEHLRTNAATIAAFLDRKIAIEKPSAGHP